MISFIRDRYLFLIAPILALAPALGAWAVIPFTDTLILADIDARVMIITKTSLQKVSMPSWSATDESAL